LQPIRGAVDGFMQPNGERGVFVIRASARVAGTDGAGWRTTARLTDLALRRLRSILHLTADGAASPEPLSFASYLRASMFRYYQDGNRLALIEAGMGEDGGVVIGVVEGPRSEFPGAAQTILNS